MRVEGIDLLFNEPQRQLGITDTCPRTSSEGQCGGSACSEHAQCVDRWDRATCSCQSGWSGARCNKGKTKSSFSVKHLILCKCSKIYVLFSMMDEKSKEVKIVPLILG